MIEHKLISVSFNIQPIPDDTGEAKQINLFHQPSDEAFCLPLSKEAVDILVADLSLSNEELQKKIEQKMLAEQLAIGPQDIGGPNGSIDLGKLRGPGQ